MFVGCTWIPQDTMHMYVLFFFFSLLMRTNVLQVHNVCNSYEGPCADHLEKINDDMRVLSGSPKGIGGTRNRNRPPSGYVFPMSATCVVCNEENPSNRKHFKQCTQCKVTRYCGQECQRKDWKRHKVFCKTVRDVKWVWNSDSQTNGRSGI
jgi:hypothetical protein